ncbi:MAG TPA: BMP family ABC transporter substrate-binding protein [Symbiobacteriaceae bacterium]|jgi:basic membrane protein A and related proteins|nr:BMP family ABC transporter substrate-binding protein [Symbiobacteriaceae bacterium]
MTRKWFSKATVAVVALSILLAGCGGAKDGGAAGGTKFKVGMSTDVGGLNDASFNAAAYEGLKKAEKELGAEIKAIESKRNEDYEPNFKSLIDLKYDLAWGIGFLMKDAVTSMAKANPNQKFALIDETVELPNVASVTFKEQEGSFLMGVIAAKTTKTKKVGFVGGMDFEVIHHFDWGFQAGVKSVDPTIQVVRVYSGSFTDPAKGKEDALNILNSGADVIFHAAGATGNGVIEAAAAQKKFAIGVDKDQNSLAKDYVISSMMKRVDVAVFNVSKQTKDGKFPGGTKTVLGLKEDGVGYAPSTLWNKMPEGTKALVDKWADAIKAGKVTVPASEAEFKGWTVPKI